VVPFITGAELFRNSRGWVIWGGAAQSSVDARSAAEDFDAFPSEDPPATDAGAVYALAKTGDTQLVEKIEPSLASNFDVDERLIYAAAAVTTLLTGSLVLAGMLLSTDTAVVVDPFNPLAQPMRIALAAHAMSPGVRPVDASDALARLPSRVSPRREPATSGPPQRTISAIPPSNQMASTAAARSSAPSPSERVSAGAGDSEPTRVPRVAEPVTLAEAPVYSPADREVVPPVPLNQSLFGSPPVTAQRMGFIAITVLVDEEGRVVSATVADAPQRLQDTMLATLNLSAAKSWRFRPALRDGKPVRYRWVVWLRNQ
jgi:hypothetical protein